MDPTGGDDAQTQFDIFVFKQVDQFWVNLGLNNFPVTFQAVGPTNKDVVVCHGVSKDITQVGPFYCNDDGTGRRVIYWPLSDVFALSDSQKPYLAYGQFAEAAVIAHEYGHFVQDYYGITTPLIQRMADDQLKGQTVDAATINQDLELQADCLSGVWARSEWDAQQISATDIANLDVVLKDMGDDSIEGLNPLPVNRGAHGTSDQRKYWFNQGLQTGQAECYTWNEPLYQGTYVGSS